MQARLHSMRAAVCAAALLGALGAPAAALADQAPAGTAAAPGAAQAQEAQQQQQAEAARPDADVQGILAAVRGGLILDGLDVSVPEGTDVQIVVQGGGVWVYQAAPGEGGAEAAAGVPSSQAADAVGPVAGLAQGATSDAAPSSDAEAQPQAPTWVEGAEGEPGSWDTHGVAAEEAVLASLSGGAYALQADGAGTGASQGFRSEVSVAATMAGGRVSLSAALPEGEEMDAGQAQAYLDALAQGGEVDAVSGATVTCGALRDAAASALVSATEGLEPSAAGDGAAWSATPLEEATKRAAALAEALDGRSVVAEDGTKAPAETVTWVVVGRDTAPDAAVAWQPEVQPASSDAHDLLVEDGTGAKGWWSAPADRQPAPDHPAADPGQTVTPPAGDAQQPDEGDGGQDGEEAETPTDPETPPAEGEGDQPGEGTNEPIDPGVTPPAEGGEGQQPDQPSDPGQGSEGDGSEGAGDDQQPDTGEDGPATPPSEGDEGSDDAEQPDEGGEGDLPAEGGDDPTMPDGTPVEDTPSIDVEPTEPVNPGESDQPGEGTDEPTDPGVTPPAEGGDSQQPDQPSDPGQEDQQPSDPVDPPQGGGEVTVPENPGSGETGGNAGGETQPEKVWVVDQEAYDEQVWVETKPAWDEEVWVVDVPASTTEQWVVDQAAWDEQVWVPNQVWVETSPAWDETVLSGEQYVFPDGYVTSDIDSAYAYQYETLLSFRIEPLYTTIHHEAQGYYEDQGYWSTVHHEEVGHMETVTVPEQGHTEIVHHEAEGYWETVHHEEVGHWEWR